MAKDPKTDEPKADDLQKKVEEAKAADDQKNTEADQAVQQEDEAAQLKDQLARCMADMQNMKRRAEEDKGRFIRFANAELLKELLPIIDNFDRGCQQIPENLEADPWVKGIVQSHDELMKVLEKIGVKKIETIGQKLDPTKHEAVAQGFGKKDEVLEEFEPGYTFNDVVIKPAKVKVGDGKKS